MQFRVLGPLEVVDGQRRVELGRPKQRAVLAVLLVHANQVVPLDRLIEELWGEEQPAQAGPPPVETTEAATTAAASVPPPGEHELVGREAQLAAVGAAVRSGAAGRGRVVLVAGEPGIGKTCLARRCGAAGRRRGRLGGVGPLL